MGFPGGADQRIKATKIAPVIAARRKKLENTLIVELRKTFNNAKKPCGAAQPDSPICFGSLALPSCQTFASLWAKFNACGAVC